MVLKSKKINMNEEEREARKSLFLKIGVFSIFALVFVLWLLNLKGVFSTISSDTSLSKIGAEIEKKAKVDEDRLGLNEPDTTSQQEFVDKLLDKTEQAISSSTATSSASSTAILEIKKELMDLTKATSTTVVDVNKTGCPPYINCMPTIGETRPCVMPAGCENITIIAY